MPHEATGAQRSDVVPKMREGVKRSATERTLKVPAHSNVPADGIGEDPERRARFQHAA